MTHACTAVARRASPSGPSGAARWRLKASRRVNPRCPVGSRSATRPALARHRQDQKRAARRHERKIGSKHVSLAHALPPLDHHSPRQTKGALRQAQWRITPCTRRHQSSLTCHAIERHLWLRQLPRWLSFESPHTLGRGLPPSSLHVASGAQRAVTSLHPSGAISVQKCPQPPLLTKSRPPCQLGSLVAQSTHDVKRVCDAAGARAQWQGRAPHPFSCSPSAQRAPHSAVIITLHLIRSPPPPNHSTVRPQTILSPAGQGKGEAYASNDTTHPHTRCAPCQHTHARRAMLAQRADHGEPAPILPSTVHACECRQPCAPFPLVR